MDKKLKFRVLAILFSIMMAFSTPGASAASGDGGTVQEESAEESTKETKKEKEPEKPTEKEEKSSKKEEKSSKKEEKSSKKEEKSSKKETEKSSEKETEAPTEEETEAPTEKETEAPTERETEAPTEKETEAPTEKETEAPTEKEPEVPSEEETEKPAETEASTETQAPETSEVPETSDSSEESQETSQEPSETQAEETSAVEETSSVEETPAESSLEETIVTESVEVDRIVFESVSETETTVPETTIGPTVVGTIIEPLFTRDFRFRTVNQVPAILPNGEKIYTKKELTADVVGQARGDALVFVLLGGSEWSFVESGYVRGFVPSSRLKTGEEAEALQEEQEAWDVSHKFSKEKSPYGEVRENIYYLDNPAFDYTLTTTMDVSAERVYGVATKSAEIYDYADAVKVNGANRSKAQVVGTVEEGTLVYILAEYDKSVVFVESGNVRGFLDKGSLKTGIAAKKAVEEKGEKKMPLAKDKCKPADNRALYYTVTSVLEPGDAVRQQVVAFATQFIGNPYKWGGESLTQGTDCSGFVMTVYSHFGYSLPRTSVYQREAGTAVNKLEDAKLGDIICYNGHVAIYIGNGQIVHASNSKRYPVGGIKISEVSIMPIIGIRRIIP